MNAKISICIPTYNRPFMLYRALRSVLHNGFDGRTEIVVSDDSDHPIYLQEVDSVIRNIREEHTCDIKYVRHAKSHAAANWSNAVKQATGDYVMKLDDDDELGYGFLQAVCSFMDQNPDAAVVYTGFAAITSGREPSYVVDNDFFRNRNKVSGEEYARAILLNEGLYPQNHKSAGVYRRTALEAVEFYDVIRGDTFHSVSVAPCGSVGYIHKVLFIYHGDNHAEGAAHQGMWGQSLSYMLEDAHNLYKLKIWYATIPFSEMLSDIIRRTDVTVPAIFIAYARRMKGLFAALSMRKRIADGYPRKRTARGYAAVTLLAALVPSCLYSWLLDLYRKAAWPKKIVNLIIG